MFKYALLMLFAVSMNGTLDAREAAKKPFCGKNKRGCQDLNNPCQCYCSWECGPRDKTPDDKPVYVENDPAGIYCYCKQRDLDHYYSRGCHLDNEQRFIAANEDVK